MAYDFENEKPINGICPFCKNDTSFRPMTLTECFIGIAKFSLRFFTKSTYDKVKEASSLASEMMSDEICPNYVCNTCKKEVMQCPSCKAIIPYQDFLNCPFCGHS